MLRRDFVRTAGLLFVPLIGKAGDNKGIIGSKKKYAIPGAKIRALVPHIGMAFATDRIMVDGKKVGYMYREAPDNAGDSGWRFFSGDEDQKYLDDPRNTDIYAVNTIANYDPDVIPYLDTPAPCAFEKVPGTNRYRPTKQ